MRKIFLLLFFSLFIFSSNANTLDKCINQMHFGLGSEVSVYVVDFDKNKVIYKKNEDTSLNTASILKAVTFGSVYNILGAGYRFETSIFQDLDKNIYIKLGGDVLFSQNDLNLLVSSLKNINFNKIYIDDSIFKDEKYPSTWLDEDKWPNQRAISPYIIDNNMIDVAIHRSSLAKKVDIIQDNDYKISFVNELKIGDKHDIKIVKLYGDDSLIVNLQGSVSKDDVIKLPVLRPDINFNIKLNKALEKNKILYQNVIVAKKTPNNATKITSISHSIEDVSKLILHNSNNFAQEVVFKVAASKYYNKQVDFSDALKMFNEIYSKYLDENDVIADASGVSRENKICVKTIANILCDLFKDDNYRNLFATSNQGTMSDRLIFLKDNLRAKTGTMRNFSSLCGIFKTRNNHELVFVTIVQNSDKRIPLLKNYENNLVGTIYKKY